VTSLTYLLKLEDPRRFKGRSVGAWLGLRPKKKQSGSRDPQLRISKAGDRELRRLLVQSAQYILGPFGKDSDLRRFKGRSVGAWLGLRPKKKQSGSRDPELRISKAGDRELRRLLVQSTQYILGPFGKDSDLRRFGERIASRGGKAAKRRAVVAVARKLSVLLHSLWLTGEVYEPLRNAERDRRRRKPA